MPVITASPARSRVLPVPGRGLDSAIVFSTAGVTQAATDPVVRALVKAHPALGSLSDDERTTLIRSAKIRFQKRHEAVCRLGDPVRHVMSSCPFHLPMAARCFWTLFGLGTVSTKCLCCSLGCRTPM